MDWFEAYMYAYTYQHGELCDHEIRVIYRGISTKLRGIVALFALYRLVKFHPSPIKGYLGGRGQSKNFTPKNLYERAGNRGILLTLGWHS
jgi:hypothetical protein